jgi:hypothetical protein
MSEIKLEAGQWYRLLDERIGFCIGQGPKNGEASYDNYPMLLVFNYVGDVYGWYTIGGVSADEADDSVVEHLPGCTGFDWMPPAPQPKYRAFANLKEFYPHHTRLVCVNVPNPRVLELYRVQVFNDHTFWLHTETGRSYASGLLDYQFADYVDGKIVFSPFGVIDQ